jgi:hypothetical protein
MTGDRMLHLMEDKPGQIPVIPLRDRHWAVRATGQEMAGVPV